MSAPILTMTFVAPGDIWVQYDDLRADGLTADEALWTVAQLLHGEKPSWLIDAATYRRREANRKALEPKR